jgi:hypothetical protein
MVKRFKVDKRSFLPSPRDSAAQALNLSTLAARGKVRTSPFASAVLAIVPLGSRTCTFGFIVLRSDKRLITSGDNHSSHQLFDPGIIQSQLLRRTVPFSHRNAASKAS